MSNAFAKKKKIFDGFAALPLTWNSTSNKTLCILEIGRLEITRRYTGKPLFKSLVNPVGTIYCKEARTVLLWALNLRLIPVYSRVTVVKEENRLKAKTLTTRVISQLTWIFHELRVSIGFLHLLLGVGWSSKRNLAWNNSENKFEHLILRWKEAISGTPISELVLIW